MLHEARREHDDPVPHAELVRPPRMLGPTRLLAVLGWALMGIGAVLVSLAVYQLWGTGLHEARAQDELAAELTQAIEDRRARPGTDGSGAPTATLDADRAVGDTRLGPARQEGTSIEVPTRPPPASGSAVARLEAPTIGLDKTVVEGVGRPQLRAGPGRYPVSALPGHAGHVAIAGHRTTHGSPFADLDRLQPGDPLIIETVDGVFTYRVEGHDSGDGELLGHRIVEPDATEVIAERGDNRLTLTSCHPRYSDRQRLVVTALLDGEPVAFAPPVAPPDDGPASRPTIDGALDVTTPVDPAPGPAAALDLDRPLGWQLDQLVGVVVWALLMSTLLVGARWLWVRGRRRVAIPALAVLGVLPYLHLLMAIDRLLPAV